MSTEHGNDSTGPAATAPTLRERMRASGVSDERIAMHLEAKRIELDGRVVTDLDQPAPPGTRWRISRS